MKLRNKQTGEIISLEGELLFDDKVVLLKRYNSLAEFNEDWEDYKSSEVWYITSNGEIERGNADMSWVMEKAIGNYFESKEDAEEALEKLWAWKRLKDKGFRFKGYTAQAFGEIKFSIDDDWEDCNFDHLQHKADLDLLFGGEE